MARERRFGVWNRSRKGKIVTLVVGDFHDAEEGNEGRPLAAEFPISDLYDLDMQKVRAHKYADYLNSLLDATKVAHDQIHLFDVLKRD